MVVTKSMLSIVLPWPTVKPSEKRSFLTLTQFLTPKLSFQAEWMAPLDLPCSSASESNTPFSNGTKY
jgi:hypothetical protein